MNTTKKLVSELTNEELLNINGGTVRIITIYKDGVLIQIVVQS